MVCASLHYNDSKHPTVRLLTIVLTCPSKHDRVGQKLKPRGSQLRKITEDERDRTVEILKFEEPDIKWKDLSDKREKAAVSTVRKLMSEVRG